MSNAIRRIQAFDTGLRRITESELAKMWGLTPRTLLNWRNAGKGPAYIKTGARSGFYREADVLAYEEECAINKRPGWKATIKRAAGALDVLAGKAATEKAKATLTAIRDELRSLLA